MINIDFANIDNAKLIGRLLPFWARGKKISLLLQAILSPIASAHSQFKAWALQRYIECHITAQKSSLEWYLKYCLQFHFLKESDYFFITQGINESLSCFSSNVWRNGLHWDNVLRWNIDTEPLVSMNMNLTCINTAADEVAQILGSVDISTPNGKLEYSILCLLAYLGIRASDIAALRFENIDWNSGILSFAQFKTGQALTLPLLDEVKYPLIDYIKNARPDSPDSEHVFIKRRAPYACYPDGRGIYAIVSQCMKASGIEIKGRHFGPHALRHSLATNLLSENVPVSGISDILGHASTVTTETYLTTDETHLKELSLEVPANER